MSAAVGQRSRDSRTSTPEITRPARCGARPRRVTSTSGSSGIARRGGLCGAPNIPKMGRTQMPKPFYRLALAVALSLTALSACAQTKKTIPAPASPKSPAPSSDISESQLYEFLLGEIALQRGDTGLAAQTYVDLAKRTRDPRIA